MKYWLRFIVIYYALVLFWCLPQLSPYSIFELSDTIQATVWVFVPGGITLVWIAIGTGCGRVLDALMDCLCNIFD